MVGEGHKTMEREKQQDVLIGDPGGNRATSNHAAKRFMFSPFPPLLVFYFGPICASVFLHSESVYKYGIYKKNNLKP